jgi:predicted nucleic acid-binding protein
MSIQLATSHAESWLQRPNVKVLNPGPRHAEIAFELLRKEGSEGYVTTDAQLAALAIEAGATLHSADTDFLRFPGLKWVNTLS